MKTCSKCGEDKPLAEYHKHSSCRDGVRSECKICRLHHRKVLEYGMEPGEIQEMLKAQGGACKVCQAPASIHAAPTQRVAFVGLNVDHCHVTGKVRGLLCCRCNLALGHAKDDPARLRALADYLEDHDKR